MHRVLVSAVAVLAVAIAAHAQAPAPSATEPAFEVASIKPSPLLEDGGSGRLFPNGRYSFNNIPAISLIATAYEIPTDQIIGAPDWTRRERYDVEARTVAGTTPDEAQSMLQTLLRERFNLKVHTEKRPLPVYALVVAKAGVIGPKMRPARVDCANPEARKAAASVAAPGDAPACGFRPERGRFMGGSVSMDTLSTSLRSATGRPVLNRTGLTGAYDIDLEWAPSPDVEGVTVFTAVQEQLGLKLEAATEPLDVLVVESVERPTPN